MNGIITISLICIAAFALNIPFGWVRAKTRRFGLAWFICIHAPIPVVAFLRITTGTPWYAIPIFLAFAVLGQVAGSRLSHAIRA